MPDSSRSKAARTVIERGWLTSAQLDAALGQSAPEDSGRSLALLLQRLGMITEEQAAQLLRIEAADSAGVGAATVSEPGWHATQGGQPGVTGLRAEAMPSNDGPPVAAPVAIEDAPTQDRPKDAGAPSGSGSATSLSPIGRFGKYDLLGVLGQGGMGVVYRAMDRELRREVALKTLLPGAMSNADAVARFLREARTAAALDHPGIVAVHEVGTENGLPYYAMSYVRGTTLQDALRAGKLAGLRARVQVLWSAAEAAAYAHEQGVVHRDFKPANILIDDHGQVHILDFGLAKRLGEGTLLTASGDFLGTPQYMPPEQIDGDLDRIGPATDVYALGAILYELLVGKPPFDGSSLEEVVGKALLREPEPPRSKDPRIPVDLETVCLKALAKEPERRYPSAREFAAELKHYLDGEAVLARRETWRERGVRWVRRRKALVGLGSALLLALTVAGASQWETERSRREQERLQRDMLDKASQTVLDFENTVMSVKLDNAGRRALAKQPLATLEMLLEHQGDFGPLYSWRGMTKALIGGTARELAEAEADLDKGCALSPERAVVWFLRGMHHLEIYGRSRSLPGAMMSAAGLEFAPPLPESAEEKRRREQGLADLTRMVEAAEHDPALGNEEARLGQALAALYRGGDAECRRALELIEGIERPKATRLNGHALYYLKRFEESAVAFGRTLTAWPEDVGAWFAVGQVENAAALRSFVRGVDSREGFGKAVADYGEALRRNPEFAAAYSNRGNVYLHLGEAEGARGLDPRETYNKAVADYGEALRRDPGGTEICNNRGVVFQRLGDAEAARGLDPRDTYGKAVADFGAALLRDPQLAAAYNNRGIVYASLGHAEAARGLDPRATYGKAVADYNEALRCIPEEVGALYNRGTVYQSLAEAEAARGLDPQEAYGKAVTDFGAALRRNPEFVAAYNNRGNVYLSLGKSEAARGLGPQESFQKAEADYRAALERHYPQAYLNLGLLYRAQRRFDEAIAAFEAGARAFPAQAAWAQARIAETRGLQKTSQPDPWAREFALANQAVQTGDYTAARTLYERGLALLDETLRPLSDAERATRLAGAPLRDLLVDAHYNLACICALASDGREGPHAANRTVPPEEAAGLRDQTFHHLEAAIQFGWSDAAHLDIDGDLASLHDDPRWVALLARLKSSPK